MIYFLTMSGLFVAAGVAFVINEHFIVAAVSFMSSAVFGIEGLRRKRWPAKPDRVTNSDDVAKDRR